jgi:hypothetical protein
VQVSVVFKDDPSPRIFPPEPPAATSQNAKPIPGRQALFRETESAWTAVAAQVERTDDLLTKLRAIRRASLN